MAPPIQGIRTPPQQAIQIAPLVNPPVRDQNVVELEALESQLVGYSPIKDRIKAVTSGVFLWGFYGLASYLTVDKGLESPNTEPLGILDNRIAATIGGAAFCIGATYLTFIARDKWKIGSNLSVPKLLLTVPLTPALMAHHFWTKGQKMIDRIHELRAQGQQIEGMP
jgi:hypothetical protein